MIKKAIIFGIAGAKLKKEEIIFFKKNKPWGIILFSRNIKNIHQLKELVSNIKKIFNDNKYPILIDVEGGNVSRINNIIDLKIFSQKFFGDLYTKNKNLFYVYYKIYINTVCNILKDVGIYINTIPNLDIVRKKSHHIIGSRSFSSKGKKVSFLGNLCIALCAKNKIATVMKHIPGHGLSELDSHKKKPIINISKKHLIANDFKVFKSCSSQFAMTAHVVFTAYDKKNVATHSKKIIKSIIRDYINFKGILISDDISMKSLQYTLEENAIKSLDAGCNLVLHCNGKLNEMKKLANVIPNVDKFTQKKTSQFYNFLG